MIAHTLLMFIFILFSREAIKPVELLIVYLFSFHTAKIVTLKVHLEDN